MGDAFRKFWVDHGLLLLPAIAFATAISVLVSVVIRDNEYKQAQGLYCARQGMMLVGDYCLTPEETITRRATPDDSKEAGQ